MTKKILPLLAIFLLVSVTAGSMPIDPTPDRPDLAEWTFIVYLAAGNNLEGAGITDMNQMELIGSDENINIVLLFDRIDGYDTSEGDWKGTRIYHVQYNPDYNNLWDYEEGVNVWYSLEDMDLNMGDPEVLIDFTKWTIDNFPAKRYALDFWNHGAGFWGICWDDAYEDALNMSDLSYGLEEITKHLGRRIDLVGFDACLMAQSAVMYQIKDYADVGVGSGLVEPGPGWPYHRILRALADNPTMSSRDLGKTIVDEYVDSYTGGEEEEDPDRTLTATMAAFDLMKFEEAAEAISRLGMAMSLGPEIGLPGPYYAQLRVIRSQTACYDLVSAGPFNYHYCFYDVIDFSDRIERNPSLSVLHPYTQNVKTAVRETMYHSRANDVRINHHGLTVYFPSGTQTTYDSRFDATLFAQDRYWDSFLLNFAGNEIVTNTPPSVTITTPMGSQSFPSDQRVVSVTGTAYDIQNTLVSVDLKVDDGEWITLSGREAWNHTLVLDGAPGLKTVYVRAFDGELHSPEVRRTFFVGSEAGDEMGATAQGGNILLLMLIPLIIACGYIVYKKELLSKILKR